MPAKMTSGSGRPVSAGLREQRKQAVGGLWRALTAHDVSNHKRLESARHLINVTGRRRTLVTLSRTRNAVQ